MSILAIGNPLLDISIGVDSTYLATHGLQLNNAIRAEDKHKTLFEEIEARTDVQYIAGGAAQNSMRVAQWLLQRPDATSYIGCIGDDSLGKTMRETCERDGVRTAYMVDPSASTGCCAVLVHDGERSLCASLRAAKSFSEEHLKKPEVWELVQNAAIIYNAGFFVTVSPESMNIAAAEADRRGAHYCLNLAAPFVVRPPYKAVISELLPKVDILFGNEKEAQTYAESEGWDAQDLAAIAKRLSLEPARSSGKKRMVVITRGVHPTLVAVDGLADSHPVEAVPREKLVDTNGAGDAYVGGFLAALSKGLSIRGCCRAGAYAASVIVQHSGCTYPAKPDYAWEP